MANKGRLLGLIGGQTIFSIVFLLILIAAADKSDIGVDWSLSGTYSLNPATERICRNTSQDITVYGIWQKFPEEQSRDAAILRNSTRVTEKLKLMAALSEHITYEQIDPSIDLPRLKQIEEVIGLSSSPSIYVQAANKRQIKIPYGFFLDRELENSISSAILALEQNDTIKISVLSGHGELRAGGDQDESAAQLLHNLQQSGYELINLDPSQLSALGRIPQDSVLFIPGPTSDLGQDTLAHVEQFLQAGGNACILADYRCPADLSALLRRRGIMTGRGLTSMNEFFNPQAPTLNPAIICSSDQSIIQNDGRYDRISLLPSDRYPSLSLHHPVSQRSVKSNRAILLPYNSLMQPVFRDMFSESIPQFNEKMQALGTPAYQIDPLITIAGPNVWYSPIESAKSFPRNLNDETKIFHLGVSIRYQMAQDAVVKDQESRMIVLASRQCASDRILSQTKYANDLLLLDAFAWLGFREQSSAIPPSSFIELQADCSEETMTMLGYLLVLFIPMLCLGLAMLTWWDRR